MSLLRITAAATLLAILTVPAAAETNYFENPQDWRLVGDAELVEDGLELNGASQAIADYETVTPDVISLEVVPSGNDHRVAFKKDFRPVITVKCGRDSLKVNGQSFGKQEKRCNADLNISWQNQIIETMTLNGEEHDTSISFQNEKNGLDRTRVYQQTGEATYRFVSTGEDINTRGAGSSPQNQRQTDQDSKGLLEFLLSLIPFL